MALLRAGIFGDLKLLARYFYPIAQSDPEGNTQAAKKNPFVKHKESEKLVKTPRPNGSVGWT